MLSSLSSKCRLLFFYNLAITLIIFYYYEVYYSTLPKAVAKSNLRELFIYKLILFPIVMIFFICLNVVIWARYKINYIKIFELENTPLAKRKPANSSSTSSSSASSTFSILPTTSSSSDKLLSSLYTSSNPSVSASTSSSSASKFFGIFASLSRFSGSFSTFFQSLDYFYLPLFLYFWWSSSFLLFMFTSYNEYLHHFHGLAVLDPLLLLAFFIIWLFVPSNNYFGAERHYVLGVVMRGVFFACYYPVKFADVFILDQFTSLSDFLFLSQFVICLYAPVEHTNVVEFCTHTLTLSIPILNGLPAIVRMVQCMRKYYDSRQPINLVNAGKYLVSFLAIIFVFLDVRFENHQSRTVKLLSFCINFLSTIYKLYWDFYMDWGFSMNSTSKNPYLRNELIYPKNTYYSAIMFNFVVRWLWIYFFITGGYDVNSRFWFIGFMIPFVELFRRCIWNAFRVEHEHIVLFSNSKLEDQADDEVSVVASSSSSSSASSSSSKSHLAPLDTEHEHITTASPLQILQTAKELVNPSHHHVLLHQE